MSIEEGSLPLAGKDIATLTPVELVTEVSRLLSTIADLQRENAALKIDASNHAADAETVRREREDERRRAEAAEAEVKRLTYLLEKVAPPEFSKSWLPPQDYEMIRSALASTGGEHHAGK